MASASKNTSSKPQSVLILLASSILTHILLHQVQPALAAGTGASETTSSSQPLWSYQVKPGSYVNAPSSQNGLYSAGVPSLMDAFNGLSQRQGALSGSPFLSILPIILIAAGGMLLLLPLLTMMMASPFSGGFGGGYNNGGFGYPQVGALSKKRSLVDQLSSSKGIMDLIENASSTIEELTRKYSANGGGQAAAGASGQFSKRSKALNPQSANESGAAPNHKPASSVEDQPKSVVN